MRAVLLTEARRIELREVAEPRPGPGEVLVRPEYVGICGTDLHAADLDIFRPPVVIGHEFSGVVEASGAEVEGLSPGDRVTVNPNGNTCGTCPSCLAGDRNLCRAAIADSPAGVARDGGMAELVALPPAYLHRLPAGMDGRRGAWVEPLAVALRAVRESGYRIGEGAAVVGAGPVGQLVLQVLRQAGARDVTVVEPSRFRREVAAAASAARALTPAEATDRLAGGGLERPRFVYECSGALPALSLALDLAAPRGHVRLVGVAPGPVSFDPLPAIMKEVVISTNFIYVDEFPAAIDLLAAGTVDVESLTTAVMPFERIDEALDALRNPERSIKILLAPSV